MLGSLIIFCGSLNRVQLFLEASADQRLSLQTRYAGSACHSVTVFNIIWHCLTNDRVGGKEEQWWLLFPAPIRLGPVTPNSPPQPCSVSLSSGPDPSVCLWDSGRRAADGRQRWSLYWEQGRGLVPILLLSGQQPSPVVIVEGWASKHFIFCCLSGIVQMHRHANISNVIRILDVDTYSTFKYRLADIFYY